MSQFLIVARHSPENCPIANERAKRVSIEAMDKLPELAKKDGVKVLNMWSDVPGHTMYQFFDAPSSEALQKLYMEPEVMRLGAFNTVEIKPILSAEDSMKLLK